MKKCKLNYLCIKKILSCSKKQIVKMAPPPVTGNPNGDRLCAGTAAYDAVQTKVEQLWAAHGSDFLQYPRPIEISREFETLLLPYGGNKVNKCRNLYTKLVNNQFQKHG